MHDRGDVASDGRAAIFREVEERPAKASGADSVKQLERFQAKWKPVRV
jgi:hypothetical protein